MDIDDLSWVDLRTPLSQLDCRHTLVQGQCFNWYHLEDSRIDTWVGVVDGLPLAFRQTQQSAFYALLTPARSLPLAHSAGDKGARNDLDIPSDDYIPTALSAAELDAFVRGYLQLETDLQALYVRWAQGCARMQAVTAALPGVRVLRQPPWECLLSFICSSNNNIKRITAMIDRLKRSYGSYYCSVSAGPGSGEYRVHIADDPPVIDVALLSFPATGAVVGLGLGADCSDDDERYGEAAAAAVSSRKRPSSAQSTSLSPFPAKHENNNKGSSTVVHLFSFPNPAQLAAAQEAHLRGLGMGYRAKFLQGSAAEVQRQGGLQWLLGLRDPSCRRRAADCVAPGDALVASTPASESPKKGKKASKEQPSHRLYVSEQLQQLPGVGPKVADCVAVFSLDQADTIPVDVHVFDIAARDYDASLLEPAKGSATGQLASLTPRLYERVGDLFRDRFGAHAGWAHSVLFAAELPPFKHSLPAALQAEMAAFDLQQRAAKKQRRQDKEKAKSPVKCEAP